MPPRVLDTATRDFARPNDSPRLLSIAACDTKVAELAASAPPNAATEQDHVGLGAKEGRVPQAQISTLADFNATNLAAHTVSDSRVDGVLGDVTTHAKIIVVTSLL